MVSGSGCVHNPLALLAGRASPTPSDTAGRASSEYTSEYT